VSSPLSLPPNGDGPSRQATTFRLTAEARSLLAHLAGRRGVSQAAVLETLIRQDAQRDYLAEALKKPAE
jgi:hypothetical protein